MARLLSLCVFLSFQILQCLSQEQDPSVGEYFLEAVDLMNRTRWRYFLPEDTDIDQDGNLSDLEVQHKFNTYVGEVFKLIDQDKDNSITEEELRSLKLDIPHLTKAVDIALENFPLRPFFLAADANGDGVYDENDFFIPEKQLRLEFPERGTEVDINDYNHAVSLPIMYNLHGITKIGHNEGTVICKSLGYDGLERVVEHEDIKLSYFWKVISYNCDGTEARLEDCLQLPDEYRRSEGMGVVCQGEEKLDALRLVGGKDSSSGDIFLGRKGMTWIPWDYRQSNSEVICRELGFSGVVKITRASAFTDTYLRKYQITNKKFECKGNEQRLADCKISRNDRMIENAAYGIVCSTDGVDGIDEGLSDLLNWYRTNAIWEESGRFLFVADANGDGKLTLEELATKGKELMTKILEFLDENQDGKISLEDINLHLSLEPILNLVLELFDDFTASEEEFGLYNMKIAGIDMGKRLDNMGDELNNLDNNRDEKLNAADVFLNLEGDVYSEAKATFLIPMLSQKLDKNQNGKIHRDELRQFIDEMFNQLDMDKNGALTLEDAYSLLRENGLDCLQVGALRSFIKVFLDTIDTEARNFFGYIFHQFDMDGNGQISPTELEQMHVPCDPHFDRSKEIDFNSNAKRPCEMMFDGFKIGELIRSFPDSIFSERHGRGGYRIRRWGGDGHGSRRGGRDEPQKETLVDKLTNRACEMLT